MPNLLPAKSRTLIGFSSIFVITAIVIINVQCSGAAVQQKTSNRYELYAIYATQQLPAESIKHDQDALSSEQDVLVAEEQKRREAKAKVDLETYEQNLQHLIQLYDSIRHRVRQHSQQEQEQEQVQSRTGTGGGRRGRSRRRKRGLVKNIRDKKKEKGEPGGDRKLLSEKIKDKRKEGGGGPLKRKLNKKAEELGEKRDDSSAEMADKMAQKALG